MEFAKAAVATVVGGGGGGAEFPRGEWIKTGGAAGAAAAAAAAAWSFMASKDASILFWPTTLGDEMVFDSCSIAAPVPEGEVKIPPLGLPTPPPPALFEAATAASKVGECARGGSVAMDASSAAVLCWEAPGAPLGAAEEGAMVNEVLGCCCWGVKGGAAAAAAAGGFTVTGPMAVMEKEAEEGLRERAAKGVVVPPPPPLPRISSPRESKADSTSPF